MEKIIIAIISAISVVIAAYLANDLTKEKTDPTPTPKQIEYVGRILDSDTNTPLSGAKVILYYKNAPPVVYTDSEGVYRFVIEMEGSTLNGRIRVESPGYEYYERTITLSDNQTIEDVRLSKAESDASPPTQPATTSTSNTSGGTTSCAQVNQAVFDKEQVLENLRDVFFWWTLTGDLRDDAESDKYLLSAFYSILSLDEMAVSKPEDTMQSWIEYSIDAAITAGVCSTRAQCDFLQFDTSGPFTTLDIEESFWRLWEHANGLPTDDVKPRNMAASRLALIALVGEECQKELIGKWNDQLK